MLHISSTMIVNTVFTVCFTYSSNQWISGDSRIKKAGGWGHCGAKEKLGVPT